MWKMPKPFSQRLRSALKRIGAAESETMIIKLDEDDVVISTRIEGEPAEKDCLILNHFQWWFAWKRILKNK